MAPPMRVSLPVRVPPPELPIADGVEHSNDAPDAIDRWHHAWYLARRDRYDRQSYVGPAELPEMQ
jgi:hypothetical protein